MFTPTLGRNPAEPDTVTIPPVFQAKKKQRSSHVWHPDNGEEVTIDGEGRWKCNRCRGMTHVAPKERAPGNDLLTWSVGVKPVTFALGSTKNAIKHLKKIHKITADGPMPDGPPQHQRTIEGAFGKLAPAITFNDDVFCHLLLRYIYTTNESFRVCEEETFRVLLSYLAACVRNFGPGPCVLHSHYRDSDRDPENNSELTFYFYAETRLHCNPPCFTSDWRYNSSPNRSILRQNEGRTEAETSGKKNRVATQPRHGVRGPRVGRVRNLSMRKRA
jgi:hypothetical protein